MFGGRSSSNCRNLRHRTSRLSRVPRRSLSAILTLLSGAVLLAPASIAATPPDTAATFAYLQAVYHFDLAILHNAAASRSDTDSVAGQLGSECAGVLKGAPSTAIESSSMREPATPRARGEQQRSRQQMQTIDEELEDALVAAIYQPDLAATDAFAAQIEPLSWSNPQIAPLLASQVESQREIVTPPSASVCADMKFWAQSDYHALSTASRAFEAAQNAHTAAATPKGSIQLLLKPYEQAPERALIKKTKAVQQRLANALGGTLNAYPRLLRTLGVPEGPFEASEHEPVLGHGRTHAGGTFVVRREKAMLFNASCRPSVSIELKERTKGSAGGLSHSSGTSVCFSRRDRQPSSGCSGEVESIITAVPASVRTVRLLLSNGQAITSSVVRIPSRDGGPAGVYVQAVRGYSSYPVSLSELDSNDRVVAVVMLRALRCHKEPAAKGPRFVSLVKGTVPTGEAFTIEGALVQFGHGNTSFSLDLHTAQHRAFGSESEIAVGNVKPKAFSWSLGLECPPHEYAIVYGMLRAPGSSVLARTPAGLVPLTKVAIAADLHPEGPLVYGVFATLPTELVVLGSDGSTIYTESLVARATEEAEFCAGYEES
jgi:hypothetical protein